MTGLHRTIPQAPRNRTVALAGPLAFPTVAPLAPLTVRGKALELSLMRAESSSITSLERLCATLSSPGWQEGAAYPGLRDELEPYLDDQAPAEKTAEIAKVQAEFAVYARMVERARSIATMDRAAFIELLLDVHRRLGTGLNGLRAGPVMIRPDAAGNKVVFPHHRDCPALLGNLHAFLCRHLAHHPALCAIVTYAALIHAHPFTDGNGRTARTLFNLVLAAGTGTRHFVPVHLIAALHRGAFLIKLRRALYVGDWPALQAFFADACRLSARLQAEGTGAPIAAARGESISGEHAAGPGNLIVLQPEIAQERNTK